VVLLVVVKPPVFLGKGRRMMEMSKSGKQRQRKFRDQPQESGALYHYRIAAAVRAETGVA